MPLPDFHLADTASETATMAPAAAAVALGLSRASLDKILGAGLLPTPIPADAVGRLAARPWLAVARGELTVLRTTTRREAPEEAPPRDYIGFDVSMTDDELEAASLRWWRGESVRMLDNEIFATTLGTFPVAVHALTGIVDSVRNGRELRHHFAGELLARVESREAVVKAGRQGAIVESFTDLDWVITAPQPRHHPLLGRALTIMRARVSASSGGPIGYLNRQKEK